ncbi:MAG TPA: hypothetical protein PKW07_10700 [Syntrophorhabdaceae bacterium]|nr:hypothetical protein [Syntrophorhabdaceae bacterium]
MNRNLVTKTDTELLEIKTKLKKSEEIIHRSIPIASIQPSFV